MADIPSVSVTRRLKGPNARQRLGKSSEDQAAEALVEAGYRVLAHDVRVGRMQIDLLAEEGGDLVFIEVKTRRSIAFGTPAEAVTMTKRKHLIVAAQAYLQREAMPDRAWRIDVVSITLARGERPQIEIIRHAVEDIAQ